MTRTYTAFEWVLALLDEVGSQPRGKRVRQCVAHPDSDPSMSIVPHQGGSWAPKCFRDCGTQRILDTLRLTRPRMFRPPPVSPTEYVRQVRLKLTFPPLDPDAGRHPATRGYKLESRHDYRVAVLERWRARNGDKDLRWERRLPSGALIPGLGPGGMDALPLYRQAEIAQAMALGEPIVLCESESSVDSLKGVYSTTWPGSAHVVPLDKLARVLGPYHHRVVVVPDHDTAGLACLAQLDRAGLARHVLLPAPGEDARDLFRRLGPPGFAAGVERALAGHGALRRVA